MRGASRATSRWPPRATCSGWSCSKSNRAREEVVGAEEHFEPDADAPGRFANLRGLVLGPGEAGADFHDEPVARHAAAVGELHAVIAERHVGVHLAAREQFGGD